MLVLLALFSISGKSFLNALGCFKKERERSAIPSPLRCELSHFFDLRNLTPRPPKSRDLLLRIGENNFSCAIRARPNLVLIYKGYLAVRLFIWNLDAARLWITWQYERPSANVWIPPQKLITERRSSPWFMMALSRTKALFILQTYRPVMQNGKN